MAFTSNQGAIDVQKYGVTIFFQILQIPAPSKIQMSAPINYILCTIKVDSNTNASTWCCQCHISIALYTNLSQS